jgi:hypothetical protein
MPLSPPPERELLHSRDIVLRGYRRTDGLYDIEAQLTDTKSYGSANRDRGYIEAGEPIHGMQGNRVKEYVTKLQSAESMTILDSVDGDGHGQRSGGRNGIRRNGCFLEAFQGPEGSSATWEDQLPAR